MRKPEMAKGIVIMIAPKKNSGAKGGIMQSRADMMNDPEDQADQGADEDTEDNGGGATCSVPISSLSVDGTPPSVGDTVNFSVEGTVGNISGGIAQVDIKTIDGESAQDDSGDQAGDGSSPAGTESLSAMGDRLRKKAAVSSGGY